MKILDFFRRARQELPQAPADEGELADWSIVSAVNRETGEAAVFRVRFDKPRRDDLCTLTTAIVIRWPYETGDQMPPEPVNAAQLAFEEALDPMSSSATSELVHVSTGMGEKEWIYYARDRDEFMSLLNELLAEHPAYPLEIEFYEDPEWQVWADMVASIRKRTAE